MVAAKQAAGTIIQLIVSPVELNVSVVQRTEEAVASDRVELQPVEEFAEPEPSASKPFNFDFEAQDARARARAEAIIRRAMEGK